MAVCTTTTKTVPLQPAIHVTACSPITYLTNPPTSGPHYPSWAKYKWYDAPVPRGFAVHGMEHGAVVISYNCPNGCADELGSLAAFLDARPADPLCTAPLRARIIVTPDPLIETKFAAAAWGALYEGNCFDFAALGTFLDMYYAKAPENTCYDGVDVLAPGSGIPADCGSEMDAGTD
jgi:Protein of unknown function (DUF3105)